MIPNWSCTAPQQQLCRAIADGPAAVRRAATRHLWQTLGDTRTLSLTRENLVAPILAHALLEAYGEDNVSAPWRQAHAETFNRISHYLRELDRLAVRLAAEGIPLVALKNGGIARGIFPCPGCCPMGDIDVLVEKRLFRRAHQIILGEGYHFEFRSPLEKPSLEAAEQSGGAEYWKILPTGEKLWFELQWRPVAGRWIRPDQEPTAEELLARSMSIPGTRVRLLAPEDNLLQVSLHTAKHTYVRAPGFRLHMDVDRIVRRQKVDWDIFLNLVLSLQVKTAVYYSLIIPKDLFDTPIPEDIVHRLKPPAWKNKLITKWLQSAGLFNPDEPKFSRIGFIFFTSLLYDDLRGLLRGILPNKSWMRHHYNFQSGLLLPYYHMRRLIDLALRRVST
jgi:hypothetical protein